MSEQTIVYQTLHQKFTGDEGAVRPRVAIASAVGLILAGGYLTASRFIDGLPGFPDQIAAPEIPSMTQVGHLSRHSRDSPAIAG
jgi:hypothetical protein